MRYSWRGSSLHHPAASSSTNNNLYGAWSDSEGIPQNTHPKENPPYRFLRDFSSWHVSVVGPSFHSPPPPTHTLKGKNKARNKSVPYLFFALPVITACCLDSSWAFIWGCVSRRIIKNSSATRMKIAQSKDTIKFLNQQSLAIHCWTKERKWNLDGVAFRFTSSSSYSL